MSTAVSKELDASGSNILLVFKRESSLEICNVARCEGAMLVNAVQVAMTVANKDIRFVAIVVLGNIMVGKTKVLVLVLLCSLFQETRS
jgi:hypothetical protein